MPTSRGKGHSVDSLREHESRPSGRALKARRVTPPIGGDRAHAAAQSLSKNGLALLIVGATKSHFSFLLARLLARLAMHSNLHISSA